MVVPGYLGTRERSRNPRRRFTLALGILDGKSIPAPCPAGITFFAMTTDIQKPLLAHEAEVAARHRK